MVKTSGIANEQNNAQSGPDIHMPIGIGWGTGGWFMYDNQTGYSSQKGIPLGGKKTSEKVNAYSKEGIYGMDQSIMQKAAEADVYPSPEETIAMNDALRHAFKKSYGITVEEAILDAGYYAGQYAGGVASAAGDAIQSVPSPVYDAAAIATIPFPPVSAAFTGLGVAKTYLDIQDGTIDKGAGAASMGLGTVGLILPSSKVYQPLQYTWGITGPLLYNSSTGLK